MSCSWAPWRIKMEAQADKGLPGNVPVVGPAFEGLQEGVVGLLRVLHLAVHSAIQKNDAFDRSLPAYCWMYDRKGVERLGYLPFDRAPPPPHRGLIFGLAALLSPAPALPAGFPSLPVSKG